MYCSKCGAKNDDNVVFCAQCGSKFNENSAVAIDKNAAKEAVKELVKDSVSNVFNKKTADHIQSSWQNFGFDEKLVTVGAIVALVGFFLPWMTSNFGTGNLNGVAAAKDGGGLLYILPLFSLASLVLIFSGRGKTVAQKILSARWQIIIGMIFAMTGFLLGSFINSVIGKTSILGITAGNVGFGIWAMFFGGAAIVFGAVRYQKKVLRSLSIN